MGAHWPRWYRSQFPVTSRSGHGWRNIWSFANAGTVRIRLLIPRSHTIPGMKGMLTVTGHLFSSSQCYPEYKNSQLRKLYKALLIACRWFHSYSRHSSFCNRIHQRKSQEGRHMEGAGKRFTIISLRETDQSRHLPAWDHGVPHAESQCWKSMKAGATSNSSAGTGVEGPKNTPPVLK